MAQFYTSLERYMKEMEDLKPAFRMECKTGEELLAWQKAAREKLSELLGLHRMQPTDPKPERVESIQMDGYTREKWLIDTEPGVRMTFYVLLPGDLKPGEKRPAVLAPHGHCSEGKEAIVGNGYHKELADTIKQHNYDYGVQAVRRGVIAFCPDARGFGERREKYWQEDKERLASSCEFLNTMAIPLGMNVAGMWTWDLMRLMDYAVSRDDVDAERVGCIGLSGGGLQTLYYAALDLRVKYIAISGYFYGFREAIQYRMCCNCNYVPHLYENFDVGDMGCLMAPRPLVIETGDEDDLNGPSNLGNVLPYVEQVRSAYRLLGEEDKLYHDIFHGPHMWHGVQSIDGIDKYLKA